MGGNITGKKKGENGGRNRLKRPGVYRGLGPREWGSSQAFEKNWKILLVRGGGTGNNF